MTYPKHRRFSPSLRSQTPQSTLENPSRSSQYLANSYLKLFESLISKTTHTGLPQKSPSTSANDPNLLFHQTTTPTNRKPKQTIESATNSPAQVYSTSSPSRQSSPDKEI
ncbi:hypothetical protein Droror1_Dr00010562 [Drosera rotundifolia]